jgi:DNA sulfur modification protein DndD
MAKLNKILTQGVGDRIRDRDRQINRLEVEITKVENEIVKLEDELKGYDTAEIGRKRSIRDSLMKEEAKIDTAITDTRNKQEKVKQELDIIARRLSTLPQALASRSTALVNIYADLERAFSESIENLRNSLRKHVETLASEAFCAMTTQQSYSGLQINTNYGLSILDESGHVIAVRSAGAEQVVALSLIDGLSRTGRSDGGPVVMDTPFGRLDLKHRDNILRYLPTTTSQLILLVHDGEIRPKTDLAMIADRIGIAYIINEKGPRHSVIERTIL